MLFARKFIRRCSSGPHIRYKVPYVTPASVFSCLISSKRISSRSILLCVLGSLLVELGPLLGILLGDPRLERVIWVRLDEQLAHRGQDGGHFGRGLPLVGLEEADANISLGVAGDVGVVDAGEEGDFGGGEGVRWGKLDFEAEFAVGVRG